VVGNVGARDRINYTLVGAVANQASRLEGLNKNYGTEIWRVRSRGSQPDAGMAPIDRAVPLAQPRRSISMSPEASESSVRDLQEFLACWNAARRFGDGRFARAIAGQEAAMLSPKTDLSDDDRTL
jgi:adenylate cyclase